MYLDAGGPLDRGDIRGVATFSGVFSRRFRYKFSYIECGKSWSPDQGCQQFYMGFGGVATSYNFAGGYHLNLQHYT